MRIKANAKINLALNVIRRREDGYHDLEMVMVPLDLHDNITMEYSDHDDLTSNDKTMPLDDRNTIVKAIRLMREAYSLKHFYKIHVEKHIPMEAGLAGGSSDAAAIIRSINELEQLNRPLDELISLGKKVGADVCFCLLNTCALVEGIGERLKPFPNHCEFDILLVKPSAGVSTKEAYQTLNFQQCNHPDCSNVISALQEDNFNLLCKSLGNTLEHSAFLLCDEVKDIKNKLIHMGFEGVLMSGSGSTVFALTRNKELLKTAYCELKNQYEFVEITRIIS